MKKIIASLFLMPFIAHATVYQGRIGTSPVFLEISPPSADNGDSPSGRYFYQSRLVDIPLKVETTNQGYVLKTLEEPWSNVDSIETFTLKTKGKQIIGTWRNEKNKSNPVELNLMPASTTMNNLKAQNLSFKKTKSENLFGEKVDWMKETHTEVAFPRLNQTNDNMINQVLLKAQREAAMGFLEECSGEQNTKVAFVSEHLVSLSTFLYTYCKGAAHPNSGSYGNLFNRQTGLEYQLSDVIQFQKNAPRKVDYADTDEYKAYEHYVDAVFAPTLQKLIAAEHYTSTDGKIDKEMMGDCSYDDVSNWDDVSWVYTDKGIEFTPYYPHAAAVCSVGFLVKWKALKPYLNPKFAYSQI